VLDTTTFSLSAGTHTLKIGYREANTKLDRLIVTSNLGLTPSGTGGDNPPAPTQPPTPAAGSGTELYLEAESGALQSPFVTAGDAAASNGQFLVDTTLTAGCATGVTTFATYTFSISDAGTYRIWGRTIAPNSGADSFCVVMDDGALSTWTVPNSTAWTWNKVLNTTTWNLTAGTHTLKIGYREANTKLDRLLITNNLALIPTDLGGTETPPIATATPPPLPTPTPTATPTSTPTPLLVSTPTPTPQPPSSLVPSFIGQDGRSFAGSDCGNQTIQDNVHIRVVGLRQDVAAASFRVDDLNVGHSWSTSCVPGANWQLFMISPSGGIADLYFKPVRSAPAGTQYRITVTYSDASSEAITVLGGAVSLNPPIAPNGFVNQSPAFSAYDQIFRGIDSTDALWPALRDGMRMRWQRMEREKAIRWSDLQVLPEADIDWSNPYLALATNEAYRLANEGVTPVMIIYGFPGFAVGQTQPDSYCNPIPPHHMAQSAAQIAKIITRYPGIQHWEIGNEVDFEPNAPIQSGVPSRDSGIGCWGNPNDPYYGGEQYGRFLIEIKKALVERGSSAKLWIGGLALHYRYCQTDWDATINNCAGNQVSVRTRFFEGILRAKGSSGYPSYDYFDFVAFHLYHFYTEFRQIEETAYNDLDKHAGSDWVRKDGSIVISKLRMLKTTMANYQVSGKPIVLNEWGVGCFSGTPATPPPPVPTPIASPTPYPSGCDSPLFRQLQANLAARVVVRAMSEGVAAFSYLGWTTDWQTVELLDKNENSKQVHRGLNAVSGYLENARYVSRAYDVYNSAVVEAHKLVRCKTDGTRDEIYVLWLQDQTKMANESFKLAVPYPYGSFSYNGISAVDLYGANAIADSNTISVGALPVFITVNVSGSCQ
jgi:hypothetical protein